MSHPDHPTNDLPPADAGLIPMRACLPWTRTLSLTLELQPTLS